MAARRLRSRGLPALIAAVLAVSAVSAAGLEKCTDPIADVALLAGEGWIIGGTGVPDPAIGDYMSQVQERYLPALPLFTGQTTFTDLTYHALTTPEEFWPVFGGLKFADSLAQGVALLDDAVRAPLQAGSDVTVFGFSQSATLATLHMQDLIENPPGGDYDPDHLRFVLIGDPNNPIGGMLTRMQFSDGVGPYFSSIAQHVPFLNIPLNIGATPTSPFGTDIYTGAYDGWANFPQDPLNLPAVINALIGIATVHSGYPSFANLADTVDLGTIGDTNFYLIPGQLPMLWPLYQVPYALPVFAELIAPVLKLVIDWGYGNPGDPDAGIRVDGHDPIGAAGPWPVTASGHLADISGVAGRGWTRCRCWPACSTPVRKPSPGRSTKSCARPDSSRCRTPSPTRCSPATTSPTGWTSWCWAAGTRSPPG